MSHTPLFRSELRAQRETFATLRQTLELMRGRAARGGVAGADVDAAHEQWAAANALLPGIDARQRGAVLGLGVLLAAPPERELKLHDTAAPALALPAPPVGNGPTYFTANTSASLRDRVGKYG